MKRKQNHNKEMWLQYNGCSDTYLLFSSEIIAKSVDSEWWSKWMEAIDLKDISHRRTGNELEIETVSM